jgi:hydrogen cyanide synthase HcnC
VIAAAPLLKGNDCDIAVIGGGVVGMALAHGLTGADRSVTVIDEGDVALRASRGNFALIWVQGKGIDLPDYARWTLQSAERWHSFAKGLAEETDIDLAYTQDGGLMACLSEDELDRRAGDLRRLHNSAPDCGAFEILDHRGMKELLPGLGSSVVGGTFCPHDGHVNSLKLFNALHQAVLARGADYWPNADVTEISTSPDGFRIITKRGEIRARKVVLAAGLGNARLAPMVGLAAPVRPQRGQIMVTEKLPPFLRYPLGTIRQTDEGGVMIGDSKEEVGCDTGTAHHVLAQIADRAAQVFPLLERAQIVRSWGALRVMSPDGYPIYDRSTQCPGAYLVTCHSGVTLAANHATVVARAILSDQWTAALEPFSAMRFADVPQAA